MEDQTARSVAIDGFVSRLVTLREEAGNPSFRAMAKRSGAISHATMHDAVQGTRLPSWETVREFASACDADPEALRAPWEEADAVVHPPEDEPAQGEQAQGEQAQSERAQGEAKDDEQPSARETDDGAPAAVPSGHQQPNAPGASAPVTTRRPSRVALAGGGFLAAAALLAVGALGYQAVSKDDPADASPADPASTASPGGVASAVPGSASTPPETGCPSNTVQPGQQPPRRPGDGATMVRDITVGDCSVHPQNATVEKVWRLKNTGALEWKGRAMKRIEPANRTGGCQVAEKVPIPNAKPGESVDVSATVKTPAKRTTCFVRWMIVESDGHLAFPGQRPIYFSFHVR